MQEHETVFPEPPTEWFVGFETEKGIMGVLFSQKFEDLQDGQIARNMGSWLQKSQTLKRYPHREATLRPILNDLEDKITGALGIAPNAIWNKLVSFRADLIAHQNSQLQIVRFTKPTSTRQGPFLA